MKENKKRKRTYRDIKAKIDIDIIESNMKTLHEVDELIKKSNLSNIDKSNLSKVDP